MTNIKMSTITFGGEEIFNITDEKSVHFNKEQTLTEEEKKQARTNIGAASTNEVSKLSEEIEDVKGDLDDLNADVLNIENSIYKLSDYEQATPIESFANGNYESDGNLCTENGRYRAKYRCRNMDKIKVRCWAGGHIPLVVFFHGDTFLSAYETNNPWSGAYEEIDVPNGADYFFAQGSDSGVYTQVELKTRDFDFNVREELDTCKEELDTCKEELDTCKEELENVHRRITRNEKKNDFAYSTFDKTYMVLTIDDGNKYWGQVYDLCHELNIPLCVATIPENLNIAFDDSRTIKDICNLVVADGGEVLCHSYEVITAQSGDDVYKKVFHDNKKVLVENGFNVRGIILGGGADYITNTEKQDNWARKYFDYSDLHGLDTSIQYHKPRLWYHDYSTIDNVKNWVDNSLALNEFVVLAMHGSDDSSDLENVANLRTILEYAKAKGATFTTWSYVYDNFKSTKLEERIKALENV